MNAENPKPTANNLGLRDWLHLVFISSGVGFPEGRYTHFTTIVAKSAIAPVERAKLLLQTQHAHIDAEKRYTGLVDVLRRVPKEQGMSSLWRGNTTNILRYYPSQAFNFASYDAYRRTLVGDYNKGLVHWKSFFLAGGAAGVTSLTFTYPLDFGRTLLAADVGQGPSRRFKGFSDCIRKVRRQDGFTGFYRGFFVSVQGIFIYRALYFGCFDLAKAWLKESSWPKLSLVAAFALAQTISVSAALVAYPWDTVRRRLMVQATVNKPTYQSGHDCLRAIIRNEGYAALYKGGLTNCCRGVGHGLLLFYFDRAHDYLIPYF